MSHIYAIISITIFRDDTDLAIYRKFFVVKMKIFTGKILIFFVYLLKT